MNALATTSLPQYVEDLSRLTFVTTHGIEVEYERGSGFSEESLAHALQDTGGFEKSACLDKRKFIDDGYWAHLKDDSVDGGELVSPIFYGKLHYDEVARMCDALTNEHAGVWTTSPGLHVHVGVGPLQDLESWLDLFGVWVKFQEHFYKVASSPTRSDTGQHRSSSHVKPLIALPPCDSLYSVLRAYFPKEQAVSLHKVGDWDEGTIEFRIWDGTVNPELIALYTAISVRLVEKAGSQELKDYSVMSFSDVVRILFPESRAIQERILALSEQDGYCGSQTL